MSTQKLIDVAGTKMTPEQFASLARVRGWGDPTAIKPSEFVETKGNEFEGGVAPSTYTAREASGREHAVTRTGGQYATDNEFTTEDTPKTPEGWSVWAGNIPGKRNTRVLYGYDDEGNLTGVNFDRDSRWYEDAAPLIAMAAGPLAGAVAPGLSAGIGSATGLGQLASNALAQGVVSGGISALTGGNFLKGALTGALGAGLTPEIAGLVKDIGISHALADTIAKGLVRGVSAELSGGSFAAGAASAALEHVYNTVAAETGAPVSAVKTIASAAGVPQAVAKATQETKEGGAGAAQSAKTQTPNTDFSNAGLSGIAGTLALARAAQQRKEQEAMASQTIKPGERRDLFDAQFAGGGMVKRFAGFDGSLVEADPTWWESTNPYSGSSDLTNAELGLLWGDDTAAPTLTAEDLEKAPPSVLNKLVDSLTAAGKKLVFNDKGELDLTKLAAIAGAAYGYNRNQQSAVDLRGVGSNSGISSLVAAREQVPYQYDANRVPGSGGRRHFTDVKFAGANDAAAKAAAQQAVEAQARGLAALQSTSGGVYGTLTNPIAGSSGTAGSGNVMGSSQIPRVPIPSTSNGSVQPGSGYGPGGAPSSGGGATAPAAPADRGVRTIEAAEQAARQARLDGKDVPEWVYDVLYRTNADGTVTRLGNVPGAAAGQMGGDFTTKAGLGSLKNPEAAQWYKDNPQEFFANSVLKDGMFQGANVRKLGKTMGQSSLDELYQAYMYGDAPQSGSFYTQSADAQQQAIRDYVGQALAGPGTDAEKAAMIRHQAAQMGVGPGQIAQATGYDLNTVHSYLGLAPAVSPTTSWGGSTPEQIAGASWFSPNVAASAIRAMGGPPSTGAGLPQGSGQSLDSYMQSLPVWAGREQQPATPVYDQNAAIRDYVGQVLAGNYTDQQRAQMISQQAAQTGTTPEQIAAATGYGLDTVNSYMALASPQPQYGQDNANLFAYAEGGQVGEPRYLDGATNGQSDEIAATIEGEEPARLSHGEFVVPSDIVSALGAGNSKAGADVLYDMMDRIRMQAHGHTRQMRQVDPRKVLPA